MSKKQFWRTGASKKTKAFILSASIFSMVIAVLVAVTFALMTIVLGSDEMLGNAILASSLLIAAIAVAANLIGGLWLLIGKSRIAAVLLIVYQLWNVIVRFYLNTWTIATAAFVVIAFAVYVMGVLGAFGLEKEYRAYLAQNVPQP